MCKTTRDNFIANTSQWGNSRYEKTWSALYLNNQLFLTLSKFNMDIESIGGSPKADFCDDVLWDLNRTWNTDIPDFTTCFHQTVLTYVPAAFLLLLSPFSVWSSRQRFIQKLRCQKCWGVFYHGAPTYPFCHCLLAIFKP